MGLCNAMSKMIQLMLYIICLFNMKLMAIISHGYEHAYENLVEQTYTECVIINLIQIEILL